ncbi:Retrovirus-related Pol polyprotein from transposon [Trichinella nativa]|uniref:Retrovirus-related Pol polyprotein from transposon n=1 Tax=Trichinella nativa TaxID=6335 RepID=A0A0V1LD87_9BILA|nr:Retrovirus-related Pol polyprotein from transposon [Trichinella nativa]
MPPECSHDMHVLWQQGRSWMGEDGLICRYRRRLMDEEGAKQLLVPRALRREDLRRTRVIRHAIQTGDAKPVRCFPKRILYYQQVDEMLRRDAVELSSSHWVSPITLVKKDETDDTLDALAGTQRFSILDLASGYWQVEVEEHDQEKTAVTTPFGLYQFKVMLFGLCNALATFQKLMDTGLRSLVGSECLVYLDDVIVFSKTAEEHTARLCEVFRGLRELGLKVKPEKCQLMKRKKDYTP